MSKLSTVYRSQIRTIRGLVILMPFLWAISSAFANLPAFELIDDRSGKTSRWLASIEQRVNKRLQVAYQSVEAEQSALYRNYSRNAERFAPFGEDALLEYLGNDDTNDFIKRNYKKVLYDVPFRIHELMLKEAFVSLSTVRIWKKSEIQRWLEEGNSIDGVNAAPTIDQHLFISNFTTEYMGIMLETGPIAVRRVFELSYGILDGSRTTPDVVPQGQIFVCYIMDADESAKNNEGIQSVKASPVLVFDDGLFKNRKKLEDAIHTKLLAILREANVEVARSYFDVSHLSTSVHEAAELTILKYHSIHDDTRWLTDGVAELIRFDANIRQLGKEAATAIYERKRPLAAQNLMMLENGYDIFSIGSHLSYAHEDSQPLPGPFYATAMKLWQRIEALYGKAWTIDFLDAIRKSSDSPDTVFTEQIEKLYAKAAGNSLRDEYKQLREEGGVIELSYSPKSETAEKRTVAMGDYQIKYDPEYEVTASRILVEAYLLQNQALQQNMLKKIYYEYSKEATPSLISEAAIALGSLFETEIHLELPLETPFIDSILQPLATKFEVLSFDDLKKPTHREKIEQLSHYRKLRSNSNYGRTATQEIKAVFETYPVVPSSTIASSVAMRAAASPPPQKTQKDVWNSEVLNKWQEEHDRSLREPPADNMNPILSNFTRDFELPIKLYETNVDSWLAYTTYKNIYAISTAAADSVVQQGNWPSNYSWLAVIIAEEVVLRHFNLPQLIRDSTRYYDYIKDDGWIEKNGNLSESAINYHNFAVHIRHKYGVDFFTRFNAALRSDDRGINAKLIKSIFRKLTKRHDLDAELKFSQKSVDRRFYFKNSIEPQATERISTN